MPEPPSYRIVLDAIAFAARAHHGQMRKDGRTPYVSHAFRVAAIVRNVFGFDDPRMLATAVLHDTVEDTTTDFDDLEREFGSEIAKWVAFLSKDKRLQEEPREYEYMEMLKVAPWQVQVCKLADVYDNLLDSAQLPPSRRGKVYERATAYVLALETSGSEEAYQAFEQVKDLLIKTVENDQPGTA